MTSVESYLHRIPWWGWLLLVGGTCLAIYLLGAALMPFMVSFIIAYLFQPLVMRLEHWRIPRTLSVVLVFALIVAVLLAVLLVIIPPLQQQVYQLIEMTPQIIEWLQTHALPWISRKLGMRPSQLNLGSLQQTLRENMFQAGGILAQVISQISSSSLAIATFIANILLIPVVSFYLLRDWNRIWRKLEELIPRPLAPSFVKFAHEANEVLSAFLRGQLLVMIVLGLYYGAMLWLIGIHFSLLIGLFAGLVSFVPYMGFITGLVSTLITAAVTGVEPYTYIYILGAFGLGQSLEGAVITPYLIGDRIGMHPVMVIFVILAGGELFGMLGILLALPVGSVLAVLARHLREVYQHSDLYAPDEDLSSPPIVDPLRLDKIRKQREID